MIDYFECRYDNCDCVYPENAVGREKYRFHLRTQHNEYSPAER